MNYITDQDLFDLLNTPKKQTPFLDMLDRKEHTEFCDDCGDEFCRICLSCGTHDDDGNCQISDLLDALDEYCCCENRSHDPGCYTVDNLKLIMEQLAGIGAEPSEWK